MFFPQEIFTTIIAFVPDNVRLRQRRLWESISITRRVLLDQQFAKPAVVLWKMKETRGKQVSTRLKSKCLSAPEPSRMHWRYGHKYLTPVGKVLN